MDLAVRRDRFVSQSDAFVTQCLRILSARTLESLPSIQYRAPVPLEPVLISDFRALTKSEKEALEAQYLSEYGVAYFIVLNSDDHSGNVHPLLVISKQLEHALHLEYALVHPLENHPEQVANFAYDGTLKVREVAKDPSSGYREQGETSEMFSMHHDGLGSGGTVSTVALYMDSPPLTGGYTYFQDICRVGLELARLDQEAFKTLFLPDALKVIRPRGKGALRVTSPVLYLNEDGRPQSVFRTASGEYQIMWRESEPALVRAAAFLNRYAEPFAEGSTFVHFTAKGHGCFIRNEMIAHGRTAFLNVSGRAGRVLARKWFMRHKRDEVYKHIPGLFVDQKFGNLFPEYFGPPLLEGEWRYDPQLDINVRVK